MSASKASEAVRRLESELAVKLLHRTTRSVTLTPAGGRLLDRLGPALTEIAAALDVVKSTSDRPAGTLRLNVPPVAARVVLPRLLPRFIAAFPDVRVEITVDEALVDVVARGCDAGIRYGESLEKDMVAVPIGAREQRFALAASPKYVERQGRPNHPRDLLQHACLRVRHSNGAPIVWKFGRDGETIQVDAPAPLVANLGSGSELLIDAAIAGSGVVYLFEEMLQPHFESGALVPLLERWWLRFPGPFLYYSSRLHLPPPLRAFVDFIRQPKRVKRR